MNETPKGTKDLNPKDVLIRDCIFESIKKIFIKYGGKPVDTPIFECQDLVQNIYGEEFNKLVYKLDDQGGQKLILRYDLTMPFARYMGSNGLSSFKRYQIGKVYRRDQPIMNRGRFREFYQCDFDIAGSSEVMSYDTEILNVLCECLDKLIKPKTYTVLVNHRQILYDVLTSFGLSNEFHACVCSTLDKIDKYPENQVIEMVVEELTLKNIDVDIIKKITDFVTLITNQKMKDPLNINKNEPIDILNLLKDHKLIQDNVYDEMNILFEYLQMTNCYHNISFSPLLARGLDYYTGLIYEATYNDKNIMESSIAAGGRYDNLLKKFSNQESVNAIGMSLGIERLVTIIENDNFNFDFPNPQVYIVGIGKNMMKYKLKLCAKFRNIGIYPEMSYRKEIMKEAISNAIIKKIKFMIIIGEDEVNRNTIKIKDIELRKEIEYLYDDGINFIDKYYNYF